MNKRGVSLVLLAAALLLTAQSPSPVPSPRPPAKSQTKQPESGNAYTKPNPSPSPNDQSFVHAGPTPNLQATAGDDRKQGNKEESHYRPTDILLTVFNGLLALFTLALVIVGALQARRLRQTVEATKDAANAAKQNAEIASNAFYAANRPWVLVSDFRIVRESGRKIVTYKVYNEVDPIFETAIGRS
jgi:hypothetical protein